MLSWLNKMFNSGDSSSPISYLHLVNRTQTLSQIQPFSSSPDLELSLISSFCFILTLLPVWFPLPHIRQDLQGKELPYSVFFFPRDQDNVWNPFVFPAFHPSIYSTNINMYVYAYTYNSADSKESACNAGDPGLIPGLGRSPGEGKGYYSSIWPGQFHGQMSLAAHSPWVAKSRTWLSNY